MKESSTLARRIMGDYNDYVRSEIIGKLKLADEKSKSCTHQNKVGIGLEPHSGQVIYQCPHCKEKIYGPKLSKLVQTSH